MRPLTKEKTKFVRIIVGTCETGESFIKKPMKMISVLDTDVKEMYEKIQKMLEEEYKNVRT